LDIVLYVIYNLIAFAIVCLLYGFLVEPFRLKQTDYKIKLAGLPEQWQGRKIAFFSDIHAGSFYTPSLFGNAVTKVMENRPDLILIGGDFIEERTNIKNERFRSDLSDQLARLKAPLGCFAVFGNHDAETAENISYVTELLKDAGISLLSNDAVTIDGVILAGLEESYHQKPDLQAAMQKLGIEEPGSDDNSISSVGENQAGAQNDSQDIALEITEENNHQDLCRIIMVHQPDHLPTPEATSDTDLILSGHSHKGQITLFGLPIYTVDGGRERIYGHYDLPGGAQQITTSGLGTVHIYARFFAMPEITIIELS
jgi:predicted MPP superfamily phosphohydrolase